MMKKTGALIIASQNFAEEDRDNEGIPVYLPMYPLDGTTVIKREIAMLRKVGISPILVLVGYQKEILKNHLSHNGVVYVEDDDWRCHDMEAALELGLAGAAALMDRAVVIPVEYPAFSRETLEKLLQCPENAVPVYEGEEGYPRVYVPGGQKREAMRCPVEDQGVLMSLCKEDGIARTVRYVKEQRNANALRCRVGLVLSREEDFFGQDLYQLLKAIDETGSIQGAAARLRISYTKGWKMVNRAEKEMGFLFLNRCNGGRNGGSSTITEEGRLFLERYHAMDEDIRRISQRFFDTYFYDFQ